MRTQKLWIVVLLLLAVFAAQARNPNRGSSAPGGNQGKNVQYREVCANSNSQIDQDINNVRARLLGGGDCWWDFDEGRYIVPKVDPSTGALEVSSLFSGSVWLGGYDPAGNLKLACQTYRNDGRNDFWPGPLNEEGTTEREVCANWDFHFRVLGADIRQHLRNLADGNKDPNSIPRSLRGWPAQGNQYFREVWGFELPFTSQGLAGFYDNPAKPDGIYEPLDGDYPSIEIRKCELDRFPDEMIFWIYNDEGGGQAHARTNGKAIRMEVQVQAFGYTTNDELNDMTFQRYKLINRATDRIDSTFFAMWTDPDLGCAFDDYIGCNIERSLMVLYNQDNQDGQPACACAGGSPTYCSNIPILGVDYFRGPLNADGDEIGMSSFMYYNNGGANPPPPPGTDDPSVDIEYYRYMTGSWKDGTSLTALGNGKGGTTKTKYAFPDEADKPKPAWSMASENLPNGDRRTLQASGPFRLNPGAVNELIIGIPWVPDIDYPNPSFQDIFRADDLAQGLFNNCFKLLDGPDAPEVDWIELNREVVAVLTNKKGSNNYNERYVEIDPFAPLSVPEEKKQYRFEGYRLYQLADPNVSASEFEDPARARPVYDVDVKNGIKKVYNWKQLPDPNKKGEFVYYPELKVEGADLGIRHTFSVTEDKFANGNDKTLINHKKYYFSAVAYAYNDYLTFDPIVRPIKGQKLLYLPSRLNIQTFTVIPRPVVDQSLQSSYGDGPIITRLEGAGTGTNFLDLDDATRDRILNLGPDSTLTYRPGRGPITVTVFNPFEVKDGTYEVLLVDDNMTDTKLDASARWELRRLPDGAVISSQRSLDTLNEQIVAEYGFSLSIGQTLEPGDANRAGVKDDSNGAIGAEWEFKDPNRPWLGGFQDQQAGPFDFVRTAAGEEDYNAADPDGQPLDFEQKLSNLGDPLNPLGKGVFVPYTLCDWRWRKGPDPSALTPVAEPFFTPAWLESSNSLNISGVTAAERRRRLATLPNVDIVLTSDKSKWSRCMVIETAPVYFGTTLSPLAYPQNPDLTTESPVVNGTVKRRLMFDTRYSPSVGKYDKNNDGLPDPDGMIEPDKLPNGSPNPQAGKPVYGMGWFPGYAVEVETGRRLNVFFGENSVYQSSLGPGFTGRDMLWNPSGVFRNLLDNTDIYYNYVLGGQHWVYVTYTTYDEGEAMRVRLTPEFGSNPAAFKVAAVRNIAWAGMVMTGPAVSMLPLGSGETGLIPNDLRIKLRVENTYQPWSNDADGGKKTGYPKYQFKLENKEPKRLSDVQITNSLDSIKVVPNPYYGYSQYEVSQFSNVVKITNLPGKCSVRIYSMDGKFIRQYNRDEAYSPYNQITPAVEWDLKNSKGIPVASGVYLIQVDAPGMGQRTIKWFGIARQFDPSGL